MLSGVCILPGCIYYPILYFFSRWIILPSNYLSLTPFLLVFNKTLSGFGWGSPNFNPSSYPHGTSALKWLIWRKGEPVMAYTPCVLPPVVPSCHPLYLPPSLVNPALPHFTIFCRFLSSSSMLSVNNALLLTWLRKPAKVNTVSQYLNGKRGMSHHHNQLRSQEPIWCT